MQKKIIIGFIIVILSLGYQFLFHGISGMPFGKNIIKTNIQRRLSKVYPLIRFDIKKIEHDFEEGDIAKVEAKLKIPITFYYNYNYNDDNFLRTLVIEGLPEFRDKAFEIKPVLAYKAYEKLKKYRLDMKVDWYEKKLTKIDFFKKTIAIYDLLLSEGIKPDKIFFESHSLIKYHSYDAKYATDSWDYSFIKVCLDKNYMNYNLKQLIDNVEEGLHECKLSK